MPTQQFRNAVFTINNPTEDDIPDLEKWSAIYIVYQKEKGDEGTEHYQGYVEFSKRMTMKTLKKINARAHWEKRKGNQRQAREYCMKEDTRIDGPWELGEFKQQGKRTDIDDFVEELKDGKSMKTVSAMFPATFVKYSRGLREYQIMHSEPYHHNDVRGIWIYGPPGTGKSRYAMEQWPTGYRKQQNKWFDGYDGEETIILDDMDNHALGHHLKIWADRYACKGETKGGQVELRHHRIVVTSNYSISALFSPLGPEMIKALERRFEIKHFDNNKKPRNMLIPPQI